MADWKTYLAEHDFPHFPVFGTESQSSEALLDTSDVAAAPGSELDLDCAPNLQYAPVVISDPPPSSYPSSAPPSVHQQAAPEIDWDTPLLPAFEFDTGIDRPSQFKSVAMNGPPYVADGAPFTVSTKMGTMSNNYNVQLMEGSRKGWVRLEMPITQYQILYSEGLPSAFPSPDHAQSLNPSSHSTGMMDNDFVWVDESTDMDSFIPHVIAGSEQSNSFLEQCHMLHRSVNRWPVNSK